MAQHKREKLVLVEQEKKGKMFVNGPDEFACSGGKWCGISIQAGGKIRTV